MGEVARHVSQPVCLLAFRGKISGARERERPERKHAVVVHGGQDLAAFPQVYAADQDQTEKTPRVRGITKHALLWAVARPSEEGRLGFLSSSS
jgi:hypothetical protein